MGFIGRLNKVLSDINTVGVGKVAPFIGKILNKGVNKAPGIVEEGAGILDKTVKKGIGFVEGVRNGSVGKAVKDGTKKVIKNTITDDDSYRRIGPFAFSNKFLIGDDLNRRLKQAGDTGAFVWDTISKDKILNGKVKNPFQLIRKSENSMVGYKATKRGVLAASGIMFAAGTPGAAKEFIKDRQGTNVDQQPTSIAPRTPAYAQDGGATGDLVFALNNLRHGGMF